ncbi:somatomedin-B and thrombospondin type-1 domain-containing protein [Bombina bombina]|uniref:somatomedin-B and thrombospondin type-1 domain-containing protein n=1 Tax=Bombina bombina TaxID=8345 RepID=UPI00235AF29A|nr:somatomedin-B and thrombospondin type-1 domain-containing protein [Bombina bombina]
MKTDSGCWVWMLLIGLVEMSGLVKAGCMEVGKCCKGRDMSCVSQGWRMDRIYGTCFCDQACKLTGDCCYDYRQACPARACVVGEWSHWSGCANQCEPTMRVRQRQVKQEPENGGDPCPPLEEKAGCLEYFTQQGKDCGQSHVPAFITTFEYNKERRKRALSADWASHTEDSGYCVEFQIESLSRDCIDEVRPYARWMQYLREGYTVCVTCQIPAMNIKNHRCYGDGSDADRKKILHWQAVGNSRCQGTWRKLRESENCSCPTVHSFIFT